MTQPFLSFYTPTFRRPRQLLRCLASVQAQTLVAEIEQVVTVDHVGVGVDGMFARMPSYACVLRGEYVHILADDDVLCAANVVEKVKIVAREHDNPPFIIVKAMKGMNTFPFGGGPAWPPQQGFIDMSCFITRLDVWRAHMAYYKPIYEGDYHFAKSVADAGYPALVTDILFLQGAVSKGVPEGV